MSEKTQREHQLDAVIGSINRICGSWNDAIEAEASIGYPSGGEGASSGISDPTGSKAVALARSGDSAARWMKECRRCLGLLLYFAAADTEGRWTGPFYPPTMRAVFCRAAKEWGELRIRGKHRLFVRIIDLGNEAANRWPATPRLGQKIGDVIIGQRGDPGVTCTKCGRYVAGDSSDPVRRVDGMPYDLRCSETVRKRNQRTTVA